MKRIISVLVILVLVPSILVGILVRGCGRDTDVSSSPEYNFQSFAGTIWRTKVEVAVAQSTNYRGHQRLILLSPKYFDPKHPKYQAPSPKEKVIAILPVGTRVRVERLMEDNGSWGGHEVTVSLDDEAMPPIEKGRFIYLIQHFLAPNTHLHTAASKEWGFNPDLLEKAQ